MSTAWYGTAHIRVCAPDTSYVTYRFAELGVSTMRISCLPATHDSYPEMNIKDGQAVCVDFDDQNILVPTRILALERLLCGLQQLRRLVRAYAGARKSQWKLYSFQQQQARQGFMSW